MSLRISALVAAVVLAGCAHTDAPKPEGAAETKATSAYYKGAVTVHLADGRALPGGTTFVKRTLDPAKGTITELVVQAASRPKEKPREFVVTMKVEGAHFTMTERSRAFTGEGELVGAPWAWTEWSSRSVLPDGNTVESHDTLIGTGLQTEKKMKNPQGEVSVTLNEDFAAIDKGAFEKARTDILNPPAEVMPTTTPALP